MTCRHVPRVTVFLKEFLSYLFLLRFTVQTPDSDVSKTDSKLLLLFWINTETLPLQRKDSSKRILAEQEQLLQEWKHSSSRL